MRIFEKIISIIAPLRCLGCGVDGKLVCGDCEASKMSLISSSCWLCAAQTKSFSACLDCCDNTVFTSIYGVYEYRFVAAKLVKSLKFEQTRAAAEVIARSLDASLPMETWDVVTFVPTATSRVRQRGYDQSQLIAREFATLRGIELRTLLIRHGQARQVGSSRRARQEQAHNLFTQKSTVLNQHILIIDDVMTTGASLESAAKVLKQAGARRVDGGVFARTI